jgi:hypothetical protein
MTGPDGCARADYQNHVWLCAKPICGGLRSATVVRSALVTRARVTDVLWRRLKIACVLSGSIWVAACATDPAQNPAWELAGHPGLLYQIKLYYEQNALEENGRCTRPLLEGVSRSEVLAEDDDQLVVRVTYRYRDSIRDEPRAPSGALPMFRECTGYAIRTFTIDKTDGELTLAGMDGPQKRRRAAEPGVQQ